MDQVPLLKVKEPGPGGPGNGPGPGGPGNGPGPLLTGVLEGQLQRGLEDRVGIQNHEASWKDDHKCSSRIE